MYLHKLFKCTFNAADTDILCMDVKVSQQNNNQTNKNKKNPNSERIQKILTTIMMPSRWGRWRWLPCLKKIPLFNREASQRDI